jgi:hypothetical protein
MKTSILSIAKRLIPWNKSIEIYSNGEDNAYPERCERFVNNSVTAKMASNIMVQYLLGKGFGEGDNIVVGGLRLIDIADDLAKDIVDNRGYFIHINYDANFEISNFKVLPFGTCRVGKKDSEDYNGKILVYKNWSEKVDKSKVQVFNVFNPNKEIVKYQIGIKDKDTDAEIIAKTKKFKGQILYYNFDNKYYYPLARIDAVQFEADNEFQASLYKNELLRRGFFGKTLVVTRPLINLQNQINENSNSEEVKLFRQLESEREDFKKGLQDFIGAGNIGGVMHLEMDFAGEKLEDAILFKNIESNIDDKLFEYTENSAMQKILMAYNNLPISLVKSPDSAMLGNSGSALKVAKESYWENTNKERNILETQINDLLKISGFYQGEYLNIKDLLTTVISENTAQQENAKAQAQLKGSVGGVQALIQIQTSVGLGTTDYNSAVVMISKIYGFDEETSKLLLGTPKTQTI